MIIIEVILELAARIFVELIFEGIILGTYRLIRKGFDFIKYNILGLKKIKTENPIIALERKLLYKKIELTENLNPLLRKGQQGTFI